MSEHKMKHFTGRKNQSGATLLVIIISMLVITVIAIAIYSMTYTATSNQVIAQRAAKAFYIAESGIRIAASEYKISATKNTTLASLNNITFTMPNNQGSCLIALYPYWFYAISAYALNATSITLYLPGAVPPIDADASTTNGTTQITFPTSGLLKIKDQGRSPAWSGNTVLLYSGVSSTPIAAGSSGTPVTFTVNALPSAIIIGDEFYLGSDRYTSSQAVLSAGGNLILNVDPTDANDLTAKMFPPQNGTIFVEFSGIYQFAYDSRVINTVPNPHTVTLTNIQAVTGAPAPPWPLTVPSPPSTIRIYMGKSLGIRSTSTYGN
jgi:Tfp pilus assembly protein PilV